MRSLAFKCGSIASWQISKQTQRPGALRPNERDSERRARGSSACVHGWVGGEFSAQVWVDRFTDFNGAVSGIGGLRTCVATQLAVLRRALLRGGERRPTRHADAEEGAVFAGLGTQRVQACA